MSTTERPKRNVTAADLGLADIGQITRSIDELGSKMFLVISQRDELLEASKNVVAAWHWPVDPDLEMALGQLEQAIIRVEGTGTLPGRS